MAKPPIFPTHLFAFDDQEIDIEGRVMSGGTSLSGIEDKIATDGGGYVFAQFQNGPLLDRSDVLEFREVTGLLDGATEVIVPFCDPRHQPVVEGRTAYAYFANSFPLRATTVDLAIDLPIPLEGGEWFSVDHETVGWHAYRIKRLLSQDATSARFEITPPLREEVTGGEAADFNDPRCLMKQDGRASNSLNLGNWAEASIRFVEHIPTVDTFSPGSIFAGGVGGYLFNVQNLASLFSDIAGTTPAVLNGPVGKMLDLSGNGNHAVAPSDNQRPYLRRKPDGRYFLDFAYYMGSGKRMDVGAFALTAGGQFQSFVAIAPRNIEVAQQIVSAHGDTPALRQFILEVGGATARTYAYNSNSNATLAEGSAVPNMELGRTVVIAMQVDASARLTGYVNGIRGGRSAIGTPRQATNSVNIGAYAAGTIVNMNAEFYGALHRVGPQLSDAQMRQISRWMGVQAGQEAPSFNSESFGVHGGSWPWYEQASGFPAVYNPTTNETWISWETYDARRTERFMAITAYDHATKMFGDVYPVGYTSLVDDAHGVPSLTFDGNGYGHVFGGAHGNSFPDMMHFKTARPNDLTEWEQQPDIVGTYTYPHPCVVGDEMWLSMRNQFPGNFPLDMFRGVIDSDGEVTWDAPFRFIDFGSDSRVYNFRNEVHGTEVHMAITKADASDSERRGVYFVRFDTATKQARNLAGTFSTGTFPLDLATMDANFRLATTAAGEFAVFDFVWEPGSPGRMHLVYGDGPSWKYVNFTSGVPSATATIAVRDYRDAGALSRRADGALEFLYGKDPDSLWPRYGDIYRIVRSPAGVWGSDELIRRATAKALGAPHAVKDAHPDLRFVYAEIGQDDSVEERRLRLYAFGDNGPITRRRTGPTAAALHFNGALSATVPQGAEVAMVELTTPLSPPIASGIEVANDAPFVVENGYLKVAGQLGNGPIEVELSARDFDGFKGTTKVMINVTADPAYTWVNGEARYYAERTGVFWSVPRKQALDTFVTALKTAGIWSKLDVLVPPKPISAYAGLQNLMQEAYQASIVHGPLQPLIFSPGVKQTDFPPGEFWYSHDASQSYIDTGFNPTVGSPQYQRNSASFGIRSIGGNSGGAVIGWFDGTDGSSLRPRSPQDQMFVRVNQGTTEGITAVGSIPSRNGFFAANRSSASAIQAYFNGVEVPLISGASEASTALNNATFKVGYVAANNFISVKWDGYFFGRSLTAIEHSALRTAWMAYEAAVTGL